MRYHSELGDAHLVGRTLVKMGLYSSYAGNFERGVEMLEKALTLVDAQRIQGSPARRRTT